MIEGRMSLGSTNKFADVRYLMLKEWNRLRRIKVYSLRTHEMIADIFTKALGKLQFVRLRDRLTGYEGRPPKSSALAEVICAHVQCVRPVKDSGSVCALCEKEVLRCMAEDPSLATVRPTSMSCLVCTDEQGVRPESMGNPHEYFEEGAVFEDQKGQWKESSPMLLLQRLELRRRLLEKRIKAMINSHK